MRSPGSAWRVRGEWALRALSLALIGVLLWRAFSPGAGTRTVARAGSGALDESLRAWTIAPPAAVHIALDSVPTPGMRDWIAALQHSGTPVTWEGRDIAPVAASLARVVDPVTAWNLAVAAPRASHVTIADAIGPLDSVTADAGGVRLVVPGDEERVTASVRGATAVVAPADSVVLRRVLVEGSAGWETKYTIAALAERGWNVDAITHVAPGVDVRLGSPSRPDTSRYAAVVAVDTSASLIAGAASAYVRSGGGLVTLRDAASLGPATGPGTLLERRGDGDVRAARIGRGRVIRIGYKDLWRRRMTNDDSVPDPVAAHRAWLANVLSTVAYAPRIVVAHDSTNDPAPLADVVDRMGAAAAAPLVHASPVSRIPTELLFALLMAALLLEWLSRRMRGVR